MLLGETSNSSVVSTGHDVSRTSVKGNENTARLAARLLDRVVDRRSRLETQVLMRTEENGSRESAGNGATKGNVDALDHRRQPRAEVDPRDRIKKR